MEWQGGYYVPPESGYYYPVQPATSPPRSRNNMNLGHYNYNPSQHSRENMNKVHMGHHNYSHPSMLPRSGSRENNANPEHTLDYNPPAAPPLPPEKMCLRFKTEICKHFSSGSPCPVYKTCVFAHGERVCLCESRTDSQGERRRNPVASHSLDYRPILCIEGIYEDFLGFSFLI